MSNEHPAAIIVMGVSGAGKSSIGERLAARLECGFVEGDRLHPAANVEKMAQGIPLTDDDRWPWLDLVGQELATSIENGASLVLSCSALKRTYRDRLRKAAGGRLRFVFLKGTPELLEIRMGERTGHFMPLSLLQTQLATLETPEGEEGVVTVDIDATLEEIVEAAYAGILKQPV
ncbi:MAG TPA: gluconokinase [Pseudorhizobium sp.]|nr:gluconokinase [Pseudorhizobium sp.]